MQFVADGEFGIETVEANSVTEAAQIVAERHAGIECVEVCKDPFWFSIAPANAPDEVRNFQVEISWKMFEELKMVVVSHSFVDSLCLSPFVVFRFDYDS